MDVFLKLLQSAKDDKGESIHRKIMLLHMTISREKSLQSLAADPAYATAVAEFLELRNQAYPEVKSMDLDRLNAWKAKTLELAAALLAIIEAYCKKNKKSLAVKDQSLINNMLSHD